MANPALIGPMFSHMSAEELLATIQSLLPGSNALERVSSIRAALDSPAGTYIRTELGRRIVEQFVPADFLVPERYANWRAPVRDAMLYVVMHLSSERLAPKLLEQLELPANTSPQERLLRLIAKVPGLQKLGQVIARNRHLRHSLRRALSKLENGIQDVESEKIRDVIRQEMGPRIDEFEVEIDDRVLSEASVSAVIRFSWRDADTGNRRAGVFKVLKPHIPACFAEDMEILHGLAEFFGGDHPEYGFAARVIPDTFNKVRQLLEHEVDFVGEQTTLKQASGLYASMPRFRVPELIEPLCTPTITAITEEHGMKVTSAVAGMSEWRRGRVAEQLLEGLVAVPLLSAEEDVIFHADPHAGNLFYNAKRGQLIMLDWALTERLSREQRRHLALLMLMVLLHSPAGTIREVSALAQHPPKRGSRRAAVIENTVRRFLEQLPATSLPRAVEAMRLLESVAMRGIRFPAALIMFSKSLFTLDGILHDIGGSEASMTMTLLQQIVQRFVTDRSAFSLPLTAKDWLSVQCNAVLYVSRLGVQLQEEMLSRFLPASPGTDSASA